MELAPVAARPEPFSLHVDRTTRGGSQSEDWNFLTRHDWPGMLVNAGDKEPAAKNRQAGKKTIILPEVGPGNEGGTWLEPSGLEITLQPTLVISELVRKCA